MSTPPNARGYGRTRAKFILIGEHSVVHGRPAIAMPLPSLTMDAIAEAAPGPLRLESAYYSGPLAEAPATVAAPAAAIRATLRHLGAAPSGVRVVTDSTIPAERGLGSSAATAGAIVHALADLYDRSLSPSEHFELVQVAERVAHGSPSGLDAVATDASHPVWFQNGLASELPLRMGACFVIADTGVRGRTKDAVADVRALLRSRPVWAGERIDRLEGLTREAARDLAEDRPAQLGARMSQAHLALRELGVSSRELDSLVAAAEAAGALGAKLTGGGQGGCMVALAADEDAGRRIAAALQSAGATRSWVYDTLLSPA